MDMIANAYHLGLADGPTEVHKVTLARTLLANATPSPGLFPSMHIPAARKRRWQSTRMSSPSSAVSDVLIEVRSGDELDWLALERHLRTELDLPDQPMQVRQFAAGSTNLTYLVAFEHLRLVVRRPRGNLTRRARHRTRVPRPRTALPRLPTSAACPTFL